MSPRRARPQGRLLTDDAREALLAVAVTLVAGFVLYAAFYFA